MKIKTNKQKGFTLIEAMIVVAIMGVVSAIAIPSYVKQVTKGKRSDAKVELLKLAQIQESYFVQNLSYANSLTATAGSGGLGISSPVETENREYTLSMVATKNGGGACTGLANSSCGAYTITAAPRTGGSQVSDSECPQFTITNTGLRGTTSTATQAQIDKCWK